MEYKESLEKIQEKKNLLDTIELKPILCKYSNLPVPEIMEKIEDMYFDDLFDEMDSYDFCDYIHERYGITYTEKVEQYLWITDNGGNE